MNKGHGLSFFLMLIMPFSILNVSPAQAVTSTMIDLGTFGGDQSQAFGINDSGQVVGYAVTATGQEHAFLWTEENGLRDLGTLGGAASSARDINNSGQVVGYAMTISGQRHAFLWTSQDGMIDLGTLEMHTYSEAYAVNDLGQVVGISSSNPGGTVHSFLWTAENGMIDLGAIRGTCVPHDINNQGQVVGVCWGDNLSRAVIWTPEGGWVELETIGEVDSGSAYGINNLGQIVGWTAAPLQDLTAFLWKPDDGMILIGPPYSESYAINDLGMVVGVVGGTNWFLWTEEEDFVEFPGRDVLITEINNFGQVVGTARLTVDEHSERHATLWNVSFTHQNQPPTADVGGPYTCVMGVACTFDGSNSYDPDNGDSIVLYEWDFDYDGVTFTPDASGGLLTNPAYVYSQPSTTKTLALRVTDSNSTVSEIAVAAISVVYNFNGFFQPIDNPGLGPGFVFNVIKAGRGVAVKFSLAGDQGLNIFLADYPKSQQITCDTAASLDNVEQTLAVSRSSLSYDPISDQYIYIWKTNTDWAGTCRQLAIRFIDGTGHFAYFRFN